MCGRFSNRMSWREIHALYSIHDQENVVPNDYEARYNIAPTDRVAACRIADGVREIVRLRWGLIPYWAKDAKIGFSTFNAVGETVAEKPMFRDAFKARRCLIPASGFYEWKKLDPAGKKKQPYAIVPAKEDDAFSFAGLWERWKDKASGETIESCTIITTTPNEVCAPIHNRMPVILPKETWAHWLGEEPADRSQLLALLKPSDAALMRAYPVGAAVGNVKNQGPQLMEPVAA